MKTFLPEDWEHVPSKNNVPQNDTTNGSNHPTTPYNIIGSEDTREKVERVVHLIEECRVDITAGYDVWVKVGFAFASEFNEAGRDLYHRVSRFNAEYNASETDKQYDKCLASNGSGVTIATFFQLAKDAGIDISNQKHESVLVPATTKKADLTDNPVEEIQNQGNGSLDLWISGSEEEVVGGNDKIQKSKSPKIQPAENGSKWILDEEDLPTFPQSVYDNLPPFLKEIVGNCPSMDDRDMILMGAITCMSATLTNVIGEYNHEDFQPMLYFFVMAEAGMGKGSLMCCRQLVAPIHKDLIETSEQQIREFKEEKKLAQQDGMPVPGNEPHRRMLFIPTNSSASAVIEQLDYNGGIGLIFDTECDTLSSILKSDYGDYSVIIRKSYHHEPIDLNRRKDNEYRSIEHPMLAICLSGTPDQLQTLTPTADDGTYSRITSYYKPFKVEFRDVLAESSIPGNGSQTSLRDRYFQLGLRYKRMRETFFRGGSYRVIIPQHLCNEFNAHFRAINEDTVEDISHDMQGIVRRLAFAVFRMMMVLTAIRFMDENQNSSPVSQDGKLIRLTCSDEDFHIAMAMGDTLIYHTAYCYAHLPKTHATVGKGGVVLSKAGKMNLLYNALPDTFDKSQFAEVSKSLHYPVSTTSKWINSFIEDGRLMHNAQNDYRKTSPNAAVRS